MKEFTRGSDPEFFLVNKDGKLVSAIPHIKGTKIKPVKLPSGGIAIHDNVAVEFATPPAKSQDEFVDILSKCMSEVIAILPKGFSITVLPSTHFDESELQDDEAREFGCSPDYNAWDVCMNIPPCAESLTLRTCGAHFHIGHVKGDGNEFLHDSYGKLDVVRTMDAFHGVISSILDCSEEALERKKLYGKSGCHRPTDYGIEYRTMSNYWMKSPVLVRLIDSLASDVLTVVRKDQHEKLIDAIDRNLIRHIIDTNDVENAEEVLEKHLIPRMSKTSIQLLEKVRGMGNVNFETEWNLVKKVKYATR